MEIKHRQSRGRFNSTAPKQRKWSDWSECTVNCIKVRHRLICDDILSFEQEKINRTSSNKKTYQVTSSTTTEHTLLKRNQPSVSNAEELLNGAEDDYADDGDEIEPDVDTDLCDKVDASKTFEEVPCLGGQCKLSNIINQVTPATTTPAASRNRHYPSSKHKGELFYTSFRDDTIEFESLIPSEF